MPELTAEKFAQRSFDYDLLDSHQLEAAWGEFHTRDVTLNEFTSLLVRKEFLTNFQVDRIVEGKRDGYFYGDYKVLYLVGSGTFARVYRAVHRHKNKVVAVKVLRQRYVDDMVTTEQFVREARMVMPLRHPNIVPIYEVLEQRSRPFMVMDFIEGQNLRDFIKVRGKLDIETSLRVTSDVLTGLEYALSKGVTHRDLKLSNVLLSSHGRAKLVDFGLAAISGNMSDEAIVNAANPRSIDYAGLERATGVRKNDPRSDIFFAGCMLYHMLAGKAPLFETRDRIQRLSITRYRDVKPLGQLAPGLPNYLIALVNRAMDLKPDRRFNNPSQMLVELRRSTQRYQEGDVGGSSDEIEVAGEDKKAFQPAIREGESHRVMIIESDIRRQNTIRDSLKKRGYRVLVVGDPGRALYRFENHHDDGRLADCVMFFTQELGSQAIDGFQQFAKGDKTANIPAVLVLDPAHRELARGVSLADHRIAISEPITIKKLRVALIKLLQANEKEGAL